MSAIRRISKVRHSLSTKTNGRPSFFIIPGFKQKAGNRSFSWLEKFLKGRGFEVVRVPILWERRTMKEYVEDFIEVYKKHQSGENYVLGFSYGAVIALLSANAIKPKKIYLCSLSPDFKEDVSVMKPWLKKYVGKRRIAYSLKTSGREVAKNLEIPSVIFYGEAEVKDYPQTKVRCEETVKLAARSKLVVVKESSHQIDFPAYKIAITKELKNI